MRITRGGTDYNPRMAGAPSPERPVVLRRLGIIKDPHDPFLQESRTRRETPGDALDLFATEGESPARVERPLKAITPLATRSFGFLGRHPIFPVIAVAAVALVAGLWAINRLVGSDVSSPESQAPVAAAVGTSAAASNDTSATATTDTSKRPSAVNTSGVRPANSRIAPQGQQFERIGAEAADGGIAGAAATAPQPGGLAETALGATLDAPAAAPPVSETTAAVVDDTIYSAQDRDVIPPQTEEQLPGPTIAAWTTRTNAMEVIVSQTGDVERVRLVTPPQRMQDTFVLNRAKVWMFKPAMKDGRPVRYRLLLTWEVNP